MEAVWYYVRNGAQTGPVTFDALKAAAKSGQLVAADLVWKDGMPDWVAARTVAGLFAAAPPAPPPPAAEPEPLSLDDDADDDDRGKRGKRNRNRNRGSGGGSGGGGDIVGLAQEFFRRTIAPNPATITPNAAEEAQLTRAGITEPVARRFAVWRRAVLWVSVLPTSLAALFALITLFSTGTEGLNWFGSLLPYLQAMTLVAIPVIAVVAANAYDNLDMSAKWVWRGAYVTIGYTMFIGLMPVTARFSSTDAAGPLNPDVIFEGYFMLLPMILSLSPAVARGCIRVKMFLPQSPIPGWCLVASSPLLVLLTLATLVLLDQFLGNFLLVLALLVWIGAPLLYLTRYPLLTRPVTGKRDLESLAKAPAMVLIAVAGGILLLIIFLFTKKFGRMTLMGFDTSDSALQPWNLRLHGAWLEYLGRSLFMTVVFADVLVRMALSVWREERAFAATPGAAEFDKEIASLGDAVSGK